MLSKPQMIGSAEVIEYKGIKFRRYPKSDTWAHKWYYSPFITKGGKYENLHRELYKDFVGVIPEGFHVHHLDGNPLNNEICNLGVIDGKEHIKLHFHEENGKGGLKEKFLMWHSSEEGIENSSRATDEFWKNREIKIYICQNPSCGKEFGSRAARENDIYYCSNKCGIAHKRLLGVYNETRICQNPYCNKEFTCERSSKQKGCCLSCGHKLRVINMTLKKRE